MTCTLNPRSAAIPAFRSWTTRGTMPRSAFTSPGEATTMRRIWTGLGIVALLRKLSYVISIPYYGISYVRSGMITRREPPHPARFARHPLSKGPKGAGGARVVTFKIKVTPPRDSRMFLIHRAARCSEFKIAPAPSAGPPVVHGLLGREPGRKDEEQALAEAVSERLVHLPQVLELLVRFRRAPQGHSGGHQ